MAVAGWYNHYDDPDDEYWSEEPERDRVGPRTGAAVQQHFTPELSVIRFVLDDECFPQDVHAADDWTLRVTPSRYDGALMDAYNDALSALRTEDDRLIRLPTSASFREAAPVLLLARTAEEYRQTYLDLMGEIVHRAQGHIPAGDIEPTVRVEATRFQLTSIEVNARWARVAGGQALTAELLECVAAIKAQLPVLVTDPELDAQPDGELFLRLARHAEYLADLGAPDGYLR
ncbi:hypothetical protein ACFWUP_17865 [Nocardia sp. NPDC058658]|uniref:hypothetical protein n=1 Tax=Nocardia sp. NPDC058658 TaxID=3346580 RepID=UPI00365F90C1